MILKLSYSKLSSTPPVDLPASKSISNRLLLIKALCQEKFSIQDLSDAEDTVVLRAALESSQVQLDLKMAGTAMRFLLAYYAATGQKKKLVGDSRLNERPIGELVKVLSQMGAKIKFLEEKGFPPVQIFPSGKLKGGNYKIDSSVSSQFISAVLLIAPYLKSSLQLKLSRSVVSRPYLNMTIRLMKKFGAQVLDRERKVIVKNHPYQFKGKIKVEKDWSSAAFFYQLVAMGLPELFLNGLQSDSIQGDRNLQQIFEKFGVKSTFTEKGVMIKKQFVPEKKSMYFDLVENPDLIPSVAVCAAVLFEKTEIEGVKTLRIKESNRVIVLKEELLKIGVEVFDQEKNIIQIYSAKRSKKPDVAFHAHNDHRIAMALAPLVVPFGKLEIHEAEVVKKSFPDFWKALRGIGISQSIISS